MRQQSRTLYVALWVLVVLLVGGLGWEGRRQGQGFQSATPATLGFSRERLGRLDAVRQRAVDDGHIAGMVTLIARRGQIAHLKAYGSADPERGVPMRTDAIFRIGSTNEAGDLGCADATAGRKGVCSSPIRYRSTSRRSRPLAQRLGAILWDLAPMTAR